jgi:hypothetical protein
VPAAPELPEALYFAFDRVTPFDPGSAPVRTAPVPNYDVASKMRQL